MAKSKSYLIAFLAAIIGIIVLLTPIAYHDSILGESYIWMWGLYTYKPLFGSTEFNFSDDSKFLSWGLIATLITFLATLILIMTARKAGRKNRKYGFLWICCGILYIVAPLVFYFGVSSEFPSWISELFWEIYNFHFAFFGSFVAGGLAIIAGLL